MSGNKSLTTFVYHVYHFRRQPGLRLAFDAVKIMENLAAFIATRVKSVAPEEKKAIIKLLQKDIGSQNIGQKHVNKLSEILEKVEKRTVNEIGR